MQTENGIFKNQVQLRRLKVFKKLLQACRAASMLNEPREDP